MEANVDLSRRVISSEETFRRAVPDFFAGGPNMPEENRHRRRLVESLSSDPPAILAAHAAVDAWAVNLAGNDLERKYNALTYLLEQFRAGTKPAEIAAGIERLLEGRAP